MKTVLSGLLAVFIAGCSSAADGTNVDSRGAAVSGGPADEAPAGDRAPTPPPRAAPPPSTPANPSSAPPPPPLPPAGVTCIATETGVAGPGCDPANLPAAMTSTLTNVAITRTSVPDHLCISSYYVMRLANITGGNKACLWGPDGGGVEYVGSITVSGTTATVAISGGRYIGGCKLLDVQCSGTTTIK